jgi:hypothetical protein
MWITLWRLVLPVLIGFNPWDQTAVAPPPATTSEAN